MNNEEKTNIENIAVSNFKNLDKALTEKIVKIIEDELLNSKLLDINIYNTVENYFVDFIIIATGTSGRHISKSTDKIASRIKREVEIIPAVDKKTLDWVVLDIGNIMLHIMIEEKRDLFKLDKIAQENGALITSHS